MTTLHYESIAKTRMNELRSRSISEGVGGVLLEPLALAALMLGMPGFALLAGLTGVALIIHGGIDARQTGKMYHEINTLPMPKSIAKAK